MGGGGGGKCESNHLGHREVDHRGELLPVIFDPSGISDDEALSPDSVADHMSGAFGVIDNFKRVCCVKP